MLKFVLIKMFFNWDSLNARLKSHNQAWSYKNKKHKKNKAYRKSRKIRKNLQLKGAC